MVWSWMGGASEWITPSQNVLTPQRRESIWAGQLIMVVGVAAEGGETETPTMTVATTAMRDMMSMTTGIVAGTLHHHTTVDTGLAHGPAHTVHDDTNMLPSTFTILPITDCVVYRGVFQGKHFELAYPYHQNSYLWDSCCLNAIVVLICRHFDAATVSVNVGKAVKLSLYLST